MMASTSQKQAPGNTKRKRQKATVVGKQVFFIPFTLPGLNEMNQALQVRGKPRGKSGKRWTKYTDLKREYESLIISVIKQAGIQPMKSAYFRFTWVEKNRKRDPDNFSSMGKKLILDSLVKAGVLQSDGWRCIKGWHESWEVAKGKTQKPGVGVYMWPG